MGCSKSFPVCSRPTKYTTGEYLVPSETSLSTLRVAKPDSMHVYVEMHEGLHACDSVASGKVQACDTQKGTV